MRAKVAIFFSSPKKNIGFLLEVAAHARQQQPNLLLVIAGEGPADAVRLDAVKGVAVVFKPAEGRKCARSWKITPEVGADPEFPDITPRDAEAVREWQVRFEKTV